MEWEQISDKWLAMTQRLRNDIQTGPRSIDRLRTTSRASRAGDHDMAETMLSDTTGDTRRVSSTE